MLDSPAQATFPGTNGRIVYFDFLGSPAQLYTIKPDGSARRSLTSTSTRGNLYPVWSPDGTMVAFVRSGFPNGRDRLRTIPADGSGGTLITGPIGDRWPYFGSFAWSPDGTRRSTVRARLALPIQ